MPSISRPARSQGRFENALRVCRTCAWRRTPAAPSTAPWRRDPERDRGRKRWPRRAPRRPRRAPHRGSVRCRTPPQACPARRPGVSLDEASARISPLYRTILNETEAPLLTRADEDELEAFRAKRLVLEPGARGQSALRTVAPAARAAACRGRRRAASMLRKHRGADARASAARGG